MPGSVLVHPATDAVSTVNANMDLHMPHLSRWLEATCTPLRGSAPRLPVTQITAIAD
jgi:hypothetical protein